MNCRFTSRHVSKGDDLELSRLTFFDQVDGIQCSHLSFKRHATERIQLAGERQRHGMVDEVVAVDPATMQGQNVAMKAAHHGNEIAGVLHRIGSGWVAQLASSWVRSTRNPGSSVDQSGALSSITASHKVSWACGPRLEASRATRSNQK